MVGRDIGTVVLPDADLKIYLDATAEERARRRYDEIIGRGGSPNYDAILKRVIERDHIDFDPRRGSVKSRRGCRSA